MTLEEKVEMQERKIAELQDKINEINWSIRRIVVTKVADRRWAYWNWLLENEVSEEKRMLLEHVMTTLQTRLNENEIDDMFKKEVPSVPFDKLYSKSIPKYDEVEEMITAILGIKKIHVPELLNAMQEQGFVQELCTELLLQD